ncbi:MAG: ATP-binding protein, partial [Nitrospiraceae bacterium]|nr:ATP-binding protein [Nitrospiraceae bacterium]
MSREHKKALTHLTYGITFNQGFMLVTGEVGIGKTTIIRKVMKELDSDVRIAKITNTRVSSNQLWALINDDFGLDAAGKDKTMMLKELTNFLISEYSQGHRCMLVIDEAQNRS